MKPVKAKKKPSKNANVRERIKYVRCKAKMNQETLANQIGRIREDISKFENGTRTIDIYSLRDIAKLLNVSTDYLLGITECESPETNNKAINELTGLSDNALKNLININKYHQGYLIPLINYLLEQETLFPDEYYEMQETKNENEESLKKLNQGFKDWKNKEYKRIFSQIYNYFYVNISAEDKIHITNNSLIMDKNINDLYDYATTNEIISSKDLADTFLLKQIDKTLESAKAQYLEEQTRNEE